MRAVTSVHPTTRGGGQSPVGVLFGQDVTLMLEPNTPTGAANCALRFHLRQELLHTGQNVCSLSLSLALSFCIQRVMPFFNSGQCKGVSCCCCCCCNTTTLRDGTLGKITHTHTQNTQGNMLVMQCLTNAQTIGG